MKMIEFIKSMNSMPLFAEYCSKIIEDALIDSEFSQDDFMQCLHEIDSVWTLDYKTKSRLTGLSSPHLVRSETFISLEEIKQQTLNDAGYRLYGRIINGHLHIYVSDQEIRSYYSPKVSKLIFAILMEFEMGIYGEENVDMNKSVFYFYFYCQCSLKKEGIDMDALRKEFKYWCPVIEYCYRKTHFFFTVFLNKHIKARDR